MVYTNQLKNQECSFVSTQYIHSAMQCSPNKERLPELEPKIRELSM